MKNFNVGKELASIKEIKIMKSFNLYSLMKKKQKRRLTILAVLTMLVLTYLATIRKTVRIKYNKTHFEKIKHLEAVEVKNHETTPAELFNNSKRVEHLEETCSSYKLQQKKPLKTLDFRRVYINRKHKFLFCSIPKVSLFKCVSWKLAQIITHFSYLGWMQQLAMGVIETTKVDK